MPWYEITRVVRLQIRAIDADAAQDKAAFIRDKEWEEVSEECKEIPAPEGESEQDEEAESEYEDLLHVPEGDVRAREPKPCPECGGKRFWSNEFSGSNVAECPACGKLDIG